MATYGYCRVSTVEQADNQSLPEQERKVRAAAMHHGLEFDDLVIEPGVSGCMPFSQRPAGSVLFAKLVAGDMLIVSKLDRIFRNAGDALTTSEVLNKRGVKLVLTDIGNDPVTENGSGRMFFGMLALMAEFERHRIMERTTAGRRSKRAGGGHIGGQAPFGYRVEGAGKEAILVEDSAQQHALKWIREQGAAGVASRKIAAGVAEHFSLKVSHVTVCNIVKESRN